jgi:hypothetical protein
MAELFEDLGESERGADGVTVGAGVGGEEKAGMGAEDGQESGDLGILVGIWLEIRLGIRLLAGREDLAKWVGCGRLELQELGFGRHDLAVTG